MRLCWSAFACILMLSLACTNPAVIPTRSETNFQLTQVNGASVALWPVLATELDDSVSKTVAG